MTWVGSLQTNHKYNAYRRPYVCQFPTFIHIGFFEDRNMLSSVSVLLQGRRIEMFF